MTDPALPSQPAPETAAASTAPAAARSRPRFSVADFLAQVSVSQLSMALVVLVFGWQWLDSHFALNDVQQEVAKKLAEVDGANRANQLLLTRSQDEVRQLSGKVQSLEARLAEAQNQRVALEALYNDLSGSREEAGLAEVEQLLLIASQQLQLAASVKTALVALQGADSRLENMRRPTLAALRKSIGHDIELLRVVPDTDLPTLSYRLDRLIEGVDALPLLSQPRAQAKPAAAPVPTQTDSLWQRFLREVWQEVRQLVRVENTGKPVLPLLPPEQEFLLRENLKLRLLNARLALLSRDEHAFRLEWQQIQTWSVRYFDTARPEVTDWLKGFRELGQVNLHAQLPDLSASLQLVRDFRRARDKGPR